MNARMVRSPASDCSAALPTSAWIEPRSVPPVTSTSTPGARTSASATSRELVTTVSSWK
jgi:hypothetical protein